MDDQRSTTAEAPVWARLELFGHQEIIGAVREVTRYGVPMVEVAVPACNGYPAQVHYYAGTAIFGEHPLPETQARAALTRWPSAIGGEAEDDGLL